MLDVPKSVKFRGVNTIKQSITITGCSLLCLRPSVSPTSHRACCLASHLGIMLDAIMGYSNRHVAPSDRLATVLGQK